jgi:hypothetical protein
MSIIENRNLVTAEDTIRQFFKAYEYKQEGNQIIEDIEILLFKRKLINAFRDFFVFITILKAFIKF